MSMEPIADELLQFIHVMFGTLDHLRILLLLQASPERAWHAAVISGYLHLQPDIVQKSLDILSQKGCIALSDESGLRYRYQPASLEIASQVTAVAELDRTRPVTLIRLIYQQG